MDASPRPCRVVLSDALRELADREARLTKLGAELAETRTAIKALRRLLGDRAPAPPTTRASVQPPDAKGYERGSLTARVIEAVRTSLDPISRDEIAQRCGASRGLHLALKSALGQGKLELIDGERYGIPTMAGASTEDQMLASGAKP